MRTLLTTLAALALAACAQDTDDGADAGLEPGRTTLALTFVSGHLGNYWDCPEEALSLPGGGAPGAPAERAEAGDCAEDCGLLNCDAAMVVIQVENTGDVGLATLRAEDLIIHLAPPQASEILAVTDAATGAPPGPLAPGASVQIRVDFRGPPAGDWREQLPVEVDVVGDDAAGPAARESLETPGLSRLSAVAT